MDRSAPTNLLHARGFTLIELMISIAIVLVLMLGINFVFSMSSRTISTGMALSAVGRDMRNARKVMQADFDNCVGRDEMPALLIQSDQLFAWRNKQDKLADYDGNPATYDLDGQQGNGDEMTATAAVPNARSHRLDRISFFVSNAAGDYTRQTGDATTYVNPETSKEAWVWYGPLRLAPAANAAGKIDDTYYAKPGVVSEQANPNNYFAGQWTVGRHVTLLKKPPYSTATASVFATGVGVTNLEFPIATANLAREMAPNGPYPTATPWLVPESRVDMANATIAEVRQSLPLAAAIPPSGPPVWAVDADGGLGGAAGPLDIVDYRSIVTNSPAKLGPSLNFLYWCKSFLNKQQNSNPSFPIAMANQTREAALATPAFLRGSSQFIVEFAGDFYDQGTPGNSEPLGTIDYDVITTGGIQSERIHWYGMPRDADLDGTPEVQPVVTPPINGTGPVPQPRFAMNGTRPAFEFFTTPLAAGASAIWGWGPTTPGGDPVAATATNPISTPATGAYNVRPSLVRITIELIDANGRLDDGQRIEFIFKLKS